MTQEKQTVGLSLPLRALFPPPEWYGDLIRMARSTYETQPEIATVISQMAVEAYVELALAALLRRSRQSDAEVEATLRAIAPFNFRQDEAREKWQLLTGDRITQTTKWPAYIDHIKRRNLIMHRGGRTTTADASASIEACAGLIQHMQNVLRPILA